MSTLQREISETKCQRLIVSFTFDTGVIKGKLREDCMLLGEELNYF